MAVLKLNCCRYFYATFRKNWATFFQHLVTLGLTYRSVNCVKTVLSDILCLATCWLWQRVSPDILLELKATILI